ncbi:transposase [Rhodoblastus sphagnicola]|uniref:transposase n=1 Tax=Rhodoblastus sphagnicola TaxID=333368 RepID=UPI0011AFE055
MVAYRHECSRASNCATRHLGHYRGILQCMVTLDITSAPPPQSNGLRLPGCCPHLRRRFFGLHANGGSAGSIATVTLS